MAATHITGHGQNDSNGAVPIEDSKDYAYGYDVMMARRSQIELGCEALNCKTGLGFFNSQ